MSYHDHEMSDGTPSLIVAGLVILLAGILAAVVLSGIARRSIDGLLTPANQQGGDQYATAREDGDRGEQGTGGGPESKSDADGTIRADDAELHALLSAEEDVIETAYDHTQPLLPVVWGSPRPDAYAYCDGTTIYFVKSLYRRDDWPFNLEVIRHEVAHAVVGTPHRHDEIWKREFDRLMALAPELRAIGDRTTD